MKNTFVFYDHNSVFTFDQRNFGIVDKLPTIICLVYDVANAFLPIHSNFKWVHKATWINKSVSDCYSCEQNYNLQTGIFERKSIHNFVINKYLPNRMVANSFIIISTVYHFSGHTRTYILIANKKPFKYLQEVVCFERKNCKQIS